MADRKIVQIMPSEGWGATFEDGDEEIISPLVGWALVQDPAGTTAVVGLVASDNEVTLADAESDFKGYVYLRTALSEALDLDDDAFMDEAFDEEFDDEDDEYDDDGAGGAQDDGPAFDPKAGHLN
jgi:hypothetical protein